MCIIGPVGSGKTSLLNAIFGEMAFIEDKHIEEAGGMEAELTDEQLFEMQKKVVRTECAHPGIIKRGSTSYVE